MFFTNVIANAVSTGDDTILVIPREGYGRKLIACKLSLNKALLPKSSYFACLDGVGFYLIIAIAWFFIYKDLCSG
jgi:hypothetical protein